MNFCATPTYFYADEYQAAVMIWELWPVLDTKGSLEVLVGGVDKKKSE